MSNQNSSRPRSCCTHHHSECAVSSGGTVGALLNRTRVHAFYREILGFCRLAPATANAHVGQARRHVTVVVVVVVACARQQDGDKTYKLNNNRHRGRPVPHTPKPRPSTIARLTIYYVCVCVCALRALAASATVRRRVMHAHRRIARTHARTLVRTQPFNARVRVRVHTVHMHPLRERAECEFLIKNKNSHLGVGAHA